MGCVTENTPAFHAKALNLVRSVRWFGGAMAGCDFFVCVVNEVDPAYARRYEHLGATVRTAPPFSRRLPLSNKLRLLELPGIDAYDTVMLLDCDTVVVRDPRPFLDGEVLQAKIADLPTTPHHVFQRLFRRFDLPLPDREYRCTLNAAPTIWYCNTGVLVFPRPILSTLGPAWGRMIKALLERLDLFGEHAYFCEQAGLSLAFAAHPATFRELPPSMNFPLHLIRRQSPPALETCDPVILHYHDRVDPDGYLTSTPYPAAQKRIDAFNERLRRHRRSRMAMGNGPARSRGKEGKGPRRDADRKETSKSIPRGKKRFKGMKTPPTPLFIVGSMRSGTTLLAEMLGLSDGVVYCPFELKRIWSEVGCVSMGSPATRDAICTSVGANEATPELAERLWRAFLGEVRKHRKPKETAAFFLNKNPHLCNKLPFVDALFPNARFIWIHRDPLSVVASLKILFEAACRRHKTWHHWPEFHGAFRCWDVFHYALPRVGVDPTRCFPGGDVRHLAAYWLESNHAVAEFFKTIPEHRRLTVREERLVVEPDVQSARCLDFLELPKNSAAGGPGVEPDASRNRLWKTRLSLKEQKAVRAFLETHAQAIHKLFPDENQDPRRREPPAPRRKGPGRGGATVHLRRPLDVRLLDKTARSASMLVSLEYGPAVAINETGRTIWRLCDGSRDPGDVLRALEARFPDAGKETLTRDLNAFIDHMVGRGFLRLSPGRGVSAAPGKNGVEPDPSKIRTVCLTLGPYRNLTTLTAGVVGLHPSCQVLNHGALRILPEENLNFLRRWSRTRLHRFIQRAVAISGEWRAGKGGGAIAASHAFFNHDVMRRTWRSRYGGALFKEDMTCLFWKDSMVLSNFIRRNQTDLGGIFARSDALRFLAPIRNPMDCAISNYRLDANRSLELKNFTLEAILVRVIDEIVRFLDLQNAHPGRFFHFFEDEFDENLLQRLAVFLHIEPDRRWIHDSLRCYRLKKSYAYAPEFIDLYNRIIRTRFSDRPSVLKKLEKFSERAERLDPHAPPLVRGSAMHRDAPESVAAILVKTGPARMLDVTEQSIVRLCDGVRTRKEILEALSTGSGVDEGLRRRELDRFLDDLIHQGFLTLSPASGGRR